VNRTPNLFVDLEKTFDKSVFMQHRTVFLDGFVLDSKNLVDCD
jgi:hypothetical protein